MRITLIGSGNMATVLGKILRRKNHVIHEVYSRNPDHAAALARELNAKPVTTIAELDHDADIYIIAITDDSIAEMASRLCVKDKLVIHTAGSVSKEVLKTAGINYGVLWPMKMIRRQMEELGDVTIVIDGNTENVTDRIRELTAELSSNIIQAGDETRAKMHMLAAIVSNFPNHLYSLAADYCAAEQIDFKLFHSIIEDSTQQLKQHPPKEIQAGPAFRGDQQTIGKHELLLQPYPRILKMYHALTENIAAYFGKKLS